MKINEINEGPLGNLAGAAARRYAQANPGRAGAAAAGKFSSGKREQAKFNKATDLLFTKWANRRDLSGDKFEPFISKFFGGRELGDNIPDGSNDREVKEWLHTMIQKHWGTPVPVKPRLRGPAAVVRPGAQQ